MINMIMHLLQLLASIAWYSDLEKHFLFKVTSAIFGRRFNDLNIWDLMGEMEDKVTPRGPVIRRKYERRSNCCRCGGSCYNYEVRLGAKVFNANTDPAIPVLNDLTGGILARYVRLLPLTYHSFPTIRWELLGCSKDIQPIVNYHPSPPITPLVSGVSNCIKVVDTTNTQIRMQWKRLRTNFYTTNVTLSGSSLICSRYFTTVGIAVNSTGCNTQYDMCKMEASAVDGTCLAVCSLRDWQVGQPFDLLLVVTGDGVELCDVSIDHCVVDSMWAAGRNVIRNWDTFRQEISAK
ncbi:hypothetical protein CAPTEDRAFT_198321 [Capitella teleta]|uniref:Uncharacterized protein n=1 Tax=Capitella teleta TaxID=283909 RepID=R7UAW7_CAPTE|nr:hypothetical protein CAPTEDRAFT_198321 [Capitella teleta]|eukprot:ELU03134.1 hypothetical protein CAPTEDRAFT_198321 [Capitella teleta]